VKDKSNVIIGRDEEKAIINQLVLSKKAEFLALYGRRRVGKTYLIRNLFSHTSSVFFHVTGLQKVSMKVQLAQFAKQLGVTFYGGASMGTPRSWLNAFEDLTKAIQHLPGTKKIILFLDEFPWMATRRSGLLQALDHYWNHYWVHDSRLKLIICGSSASWIIEKIINNKGGLHNRVTRTMRLHPFNLNEVRLFLKMQGIKLNNRHVLELYSVLGGIPHYLSLIRGGLSAHECIDELCFQKDGPLVNEFDRLLSSLFKDSEIYVTIIRIIAQHRYGIAQTALISEGKISEGGRIVQRLKGLEEAGFISSFVPYGRQEKGIYYKISDEYTLFYFHWIKPNMISIRKQDTSKGYWLAKAKSQSWKSWAGLAFEAICYKHLAQIRKALHIDPGAEIGTWQHIGQQKDREPGAQIDLLFDRPDNVVTLCEMKYTEQPFLLDKKEATNLQNKADVFRKQTKTQKQIFFAIISASGIKPSMYSEELIIGQVDLDDLFAV
jgi:AAA+ ATPase superfamily predicted ATPase